MTDNKEEKQKRVGKATREKKHRLQNLTHNAKNRLTFLREYSIIRKSKRWGIAKR